MALIFTFLIALRHFHFSYERFTPGFIALSAKKPVCMFSAAVSRLLMSGLFCSSSSPGTFVLF